MKVAGSVARTEDFIKTLLKREDHKTPSEQVELDFMGIDDDTPAHADDSRLSDALSILEKFFAEATDAFDFKAKPVMQIRLSKDEFVRYKSKYDELCMSQTM